MVTPYVVSYERIAVRASASDATATDTQTDRGSDHGTASETGNGAWVWFDDPVTITLHHHDTAVLLLEAQAERAAMTYGLHRCRRVILWAHGEQREVDWDRCLASLNGNDPRWRTRIGKSAN